MCKKKYECDEYLCIILFIFFFTVNFFYDVRWYCYRKEDDLLSSISGHAQIHQNGINTLSRNDINNANYRPPLERPFEPDVPPCYSEAVYISSYPPTESSVGRHCEIDSPPTYSEAVCVTSYLH